MPTGRGGRAIKHVKTALLIVVGLLGLLGWRASATTGATIVLYDPNTNYQAVDQILTWFNRYLAERLPGYEFVVVNNPSVFRELLGRETTAFAMVGSALLQRDHGIALEPLLIPTAGGERTFRRVLVDLGAQVQPDLRGKRIAAALAVGESEQPLLAQLAAAGLKVEGALVLRLSKDIDTLLAINFGQAQAAVASESSLEIFHRISPATAGQLRVLWKSEPVLRPPLCAIGARRPPNERRQVIEALMQMGQSDQGRKAMLSLGFDSWTPAPLPGKE